MARKKEVIEAKIEDEKLNSKTVEKSGNNFDKLFIGILAVTFLVICVAILIFIFVDKIEFNKGATENDDVNIKYSDVATDVNPGIYITDVSEIVENVMPSIVSITSKTLVQSNSYFPWGGNQEYESTGAGSGIIISKTSKELLILTNYHVVEDSRELVVSFINEKNVNATVKGYSERKDVAVISISLKDIDKDTIDVIRIATLGNSDELKVGNGIIAIGNALGYGQSVTVGVVSALNRDVSIDSYTNKMIQIDAAINGGNSGGALLNNKGEVIGINSAKYSSSGSGTSVEGMGFAIPISDVTSLIESLAKGEGDTNGAVLGVQGYIVTEEISKSYNIPVGFYVSDIVKDSGAYKSDLEIGNIITKIDKIKIDDFNDLSNYLYEKKPGDVVTLTVQYISGRSYKEKEIKVTLSK